jgi:hypothetical protein
MATLERPRAAETKEPQEEEKTVSLGPAPRAPVLADFEASSEEEREVESDVSSEGASVELAASEEEFEEEGERGKDEEEHREEEQEDLQPPPDSFPALRELAREHAAAAAASAPLSSAGRVGEDEASMPASGVVATSSELSVGVAAASAGPALLSSSAFLEKVASHCVVFDEAADPLTIPPETREGDEFFQLVQEYLSCCTTLGLVRAEAAELLAECDTLVDQVWTHETVKQSASGTCGDRNPVTCEVESTVSRFNPASLARLAQVIETHRGQTNTRDASAVYESLIAKLNAEEFVAGVFAEPQWDRVFGESSSASELPSEGAVLDVLHMVDVLFYFERTLAHESLFGGSDSSPDDSGRSDALSSFRTDIRRWVLHLCRVLLKYCGMREEDDLALEARTFNVRLRLTEHAVRCSGISEWDGQEVVSFPQNMLDTPQLAWFAKAILSPLILKLPQGFNNNAPESEELRLVSDGALERTASSPASQDSSDGYDPDWVVVSDDGATPERPVDRFAYLLTEGDFAALVDRIPKLSFDSGSVDNHMLWLNVQCVVHTALSALVTLESYPYLTRVLAKLCVNALSASSVAQETFPDAAEALCVHAWKTMLDHDHLWAFLSELPLTMIPANSRWRAFTYCLTARSKRSSVAQLEAAHTRLEFNSRDEWLSWFYTPGNSVLIAVKRGQTPTCGVVKSIVRLAVEQPTLAELLLGACVELSIAPCPPAGDRTVHDISSTLLENLVCLGFLVPSCTFVSYPTVKETLGPLKQEYQQQLTQNRGGAQRASVLKFSSPLIERLCCEVSALETAASRLPGSTGLNTGTILGSAMSLLHHNMKYFGTLSLAYVKLLPIHLWRIDEQDVSIARSWVSGMANHPEHAAGRYVFSRLNYDTVNDGTRLFLEPTVHMKIALELSAVYFQKHMQVGMFGYSENQQLFSGWLWSVLMSLKHYHLGEPLCASLNLDSPPDWASQICALISHHAEPSGTQPANPVASFLALQFSSHGEQLLTNLRSQKIFRGLVDHHFDMPALRVLHDCLPSSVETAGGAKAVGGMLVSESKCPLVVSSFVDSLWLLAAQSSRVSTAMGEAAATSATSKIASEEVAARQSGVKRKGMFATLSGMFSGLASMPRQVSPDIAIQLSSMCHVQMSELGLSGLEVVWLCACIAKRRWWRHQGLCFIINDVLHRLHAPPPDFFRDMLRRQWDASLEDWTKDKRSKQKLPEGAQDVGGLWSDAAVSGVFFLPEFPWLAFEVLLAMDRSAAVARSLEQFEIAIADAARTAARPDTPGGEILGAVKFLVDFGTNLEVTRLPEYLWLICALEVSPWEPAYVLYWHQFFRHFLRSVVISVDPQVPVLFSGAILACFFQRTEGGVIDRGVRNLEKFLSRLESDEGSAETAQHPMLLSVVRSLGIWLQRCVLDSISETSAAEASSPHACYVDCSFKIASIVDGTPEEYEPEWILSLASSGRGMPPDNGEWRQLVPLQAEDASINIWQGRSAQNDQPEPARRRTRGRSVAGESGLPIVIRRPASISTAHVPSSHAAIEELVAQVDEDVAVVCAASDEFSTRLARGIEVDERYLQMLPHLFINQQTNAHRQVECRQRQGRCSAKAVFLFTVNESVKVERVFQDITENRAMRLSLASSPTVSMDLCRSLMRIRAAINALYEGAEVDSSPHFRETVATCCAMFHKMLAIRQAPLISAFPATVSFFSDVLRKLGMKFVREAPDQQLPLMKSMLGLIDRMSGPGALAPDDDLLDMLQSAWNPETAMTRDGSVFVEMFKALMNSFASAQQDPMHPSRFMRLSSMFDKLDMSLWLMHAGGQLAAPECRELDWILCVCLNALSTGPDASIDSSVQAVHQSLANSVLEPLFRHFLPSDHGFLFQRVFASSRDAAVSPMVWEAVRRAVQTLFEDDSLDFELARRMAMTLSEFNSSIRESCGSLFAATGLLRYCEELFRIYRLLLVALGRAPTRQYDAVSLSDRYEGIDDTFAALFGGWMATAAHPHGPSPPWPAGPLTTAQEEAVRLCIRSAVGHWESSSHPERGWSFLLAAWLVHLRAAVDADAEASTAISRLFPGRVAEILRDCLSSAHLPLHIDEEAAPDIVGLLDTLSTLKGRDVRSRLATESRKVVSLLCRLLASVLSSKKDILSWNLPRSVSSVPGLSTTPAATWLKCVAWCVRYAPSHRDGHSRRVDSQLVSSFCGSHGSAPSAALLEAQADVAGSLSSQDFSSVLGSFEPIYLDSGEQAGPHEAHGRGAVAEGTELTDKLVLFLSVFDAIAAASDVSSATSEASCVTAVVEHAVSQFQFNLACADVGRLRFFFSMALRRASFQEGEAASELFSELCDVFNHDSHTFVASFRVSFAAFLTCCSVPRPQKNCCACSLSASAIILQVCNPR